MILKPLKTACVLFMSLTILTGLFYPLIITCFAQVLFPWHANGSIVKKNNHAIGSFFIGQSFSSADYFWGRPSATIPFPYNGEFSSGSNSASSNPDFLNTLSMRVLNITSVNPNQSKNRMIPVELVTASASGLDPDISPAAAFYQVSRIARIRHIPENLLKILVRDHIEYRTFGLLGEPRLNVLQLNLSMDERYGKPTP